MWRNALFLLKIAVYSYSGVGNMHNIGKFPQRLFLLLFYLLLAINVCLEVLQCKWPLFKVQNLRHFYPVASYNGGTSELSNATVSANKMLRPTHRTTKRVCNEHNVDGIECCPGANAVYTSIFTCMCMC